MRSRAGVWRTGSRRIQTSSALHFRPEIRWLKRTDHKPSKRFVIGLNSMSARGFCPAYRYWSEHPLTSAWSKPKTEDNADDILTTHQPARRERVCRSVFSRGTDPVGHAYRSVMRNWPVQLRIPTSAQTCQSLWCTFSSKGCQPWDPRTDASIQGSQAGGVVSYSVFCSTQVYNWLDEAHPHWGGQPALLSYWLKCWSHLETPSQTHLECLTKYLGSPGPSHVDTES